MNTTPIPQVSFRDAGHGYDPFGLHPDWVAFALRLFRPLYERYFRVTSHGAHHIPKSGPTILASNHSGVVPLDGMMLWHDVLCHTDPPRVPRAVGDHFVPLLPFVSLFYTRCGFVGGSRTNVEKLLQQGELMLIFPEGVPGISKPFHKRYQLAEWRVGHAELALRQRAPVVPVAVIGAEEQFPLTVNLPLRLFGAPYLPVPLPPLPLPVHYHIYYGPPIALHERFRPEDARDPEVLKQAAALVRAAVESLIEEGLQARPGIFA